MRYADFNVPAICNQNRNEVVIFKIFLLPLLNTPGLKGKSCLLQVETIEKTLHLGLEQNLVSFCIKMIIRTLF